MNQKIFILSQIFFLSSLFALFFVKTIYKSRKIV